MKIGFIGLGNVGQSLAANLARAGHQMTVNDLDRSRAEPLLDLGASWGDTAADCAEEAELLITSLPSPAASRAVMEGDGGLLEVLKAGSSWIEMSTTDADEVRRLGAIAAGRGIGILEAPITGGCHRAKSGDISILVGGDEDLFERFKPVIQIMGGEVLHMGPLGAASVVKVITNMLAFIHLIGVGEGLMLAARAGVDLGKAFEGIRASSGNSFVHETESQVILSGTYNIGFTMDLACKDLGLARKLAADFDVPLDLGERTAEIFDVGREKYGDRAWSTAIVRLLEEKAGRELRAPGFPDELEA